MGGLNIFDHGPPLFGEFAGVDLADFRHLIFIGGTVFREDVREQADLESSFAIFFLEDGKGVADHVHLLIGLKATHCLSDFMRELKKSSSIWVSQKTEQNTFSWQEGYAAFTAPPDHYHIIPNSPSRRLTSL